MRHHQQGAALAIGLIFLVITTIIGVTGAGHSLLGERVASNNKQMSEAFMAAESGLVNAVAWLDNPANATSWGNGNASRNAINAIATTSAGNQARWQIASVAFNGKEATITSCGTINNSDVSRCISSNYTKGSGGGNLAAINIIGNNVSFEAPSSNSFKVNGGDGGAAIATNTAANADKITDAIGGRLDNYVGGVKEVEFDDPFSNPEKMAEFIKGIKDQWTAMPKNDPKKGTTQPKLDLGSKQNPKITYHNGDLEIRGNKFVGAGILVIEGNLTIKGNFAGYDGLIVVSGKSLSLSGGGNKDALGAIVLAKPIQIDNKWSFDSVAFETNGGGNASVTYNKQALINARALLDDNNKAKELWKIDASDSGAAEKSKVSNWKATTQS